MADPITIAAIVAATAAGASSLMATGQARQVGAAQAKALEMQAGVSRQQAGLQEEALRRDTRRQFGELRAAGGQAGLSESVTFADVYKQAATAAELDALSLAYQGETQAGSLLTEARITRAARPSWALGVLQAGASAASAYSLVGGGLGALKGGGGFGGGTPMTRLNTPMSPTGPRFA